MGYEGSQEPRILVEFRDTCANTAAKLVIVRQLEFPRFYSSTISRTTLPLSCSGFPVNERLKRFLRMATVYVEMYCYIQDRNCKLIEYEEIFIHLNLRFGKVIIFINLTLRFGSYGFCRFNFTIWIEPSLFKFQFLDTKGVQR